MRNKITKKARRSQQQWQQIIDEWKTSGQSATHYCKANNLSYASFSQWRRRLTKEKPEMTQPGNDFLDLSSLGPQPEGNWHITLKLGNGVELVLSQQ